MINKLLGCILIVSIFQCERTVNKREELISNDVKVRSSRDNSFCKYLDQKGCFSLPNSVFVDENYNTVKTIIVNKVLFKKNKYCKLILVGNDGKKQVETHYFSFNANQYSELLIRGKDTLECNLVNLKAQNELKNRIHLPEMGGYSVFTNNLYCEGGIVVQIVRVPTLNLVFPFGEYNDEVYINSFFWSEGKGLLALSILKGDTSINYFYNR